jgi:predicted transcriptional regulator
MTDHPEKRDPSRSNILKSLRESHSQSVGKTQSLVRDQKKMQQSICSFIREEGKTIPEISAQLNIPADEVLWFLTAMKKYGIVIETGMCGDYPLYKRIEETSA